MHLKKHASLELWLGLLLATCVAAKKELCCFGSPFCLRAIAFEPPSRQLVFFANAINDAESFGRRDTDAPAAMPENLPPSIRTPTNPATQSSLSNGSTEILISRRDFIGCGLLVAAAVSSSFRESTTLESNEGQANPLADKGSSKLRNSTINSKSANGQITPREKRKKTEFEPIDLRRVANENTINVTTVCKEDNVCQLVDRKAYTKVKTKELPVWVPPVIPVPKQRIVTQIPNSDLLLAGIIAGSSTEMVRTVMLYPLSTVKSRIQADKNHTAMSSLTISEKIEELWTSFRRQVKAGDLYAGIVPSLLIAVPASGVYYGTRDVTNRMLRASFTTPSPFDDVVASLAGAFVAEVTSLSIRTPADVLAVRLQVEGSDASDTPMIGDWLKDSLELLPTAIVTELPYALSRIALNWAITTGTEDIGRYELDTIAVACACAVLTTPFDVAKTRLLLLDCDEDSCVLKNETGIWETLEMVAYEGKDDGVGGVQNWFAGWIERTAYLGIGRAWLDPIRIIGYIGMRDALLLKLFD